jgi:hypothetical protein
MEDTGFQRFLHMGYFGAKKDLYISWDSILLSEDISRKENCCLESRREFECPATTVTWNPIEYSQT